MRKVKGIFILDRSAYELVFSSQERSEIAKYVDFVAEPQTAESIRRMPQLLRDVEVVFSGWGGPLIDEAFCMLAPRLRAVFYAAGSAAGIMTPAVWEREIQVTSAYAANAVPVAEFSLATILFSLKHGWSLSRQTIEQRQYPPRDGAPGCYGSVVGLISLGMIARTLIKLLEPFDLRLIAFDPLLSQSEAAELGVELLDSLEEVFRQSHVVSLHSPLLTETQGMIRGSHFHSMRPGATFINTARGQIVCEQEMIEVLEERPDLHAVLDVTHDEPPAADSALYSMANVTLTPHIAGSVGAECRRMGQYMVDELKRYVDGSPLRWVVTPELAFQSSHRPPGMTSLAGIKVRVPAAAASPRIATVVASNGSAYRATAPA